MQFRGPRPSCQASPKYYGVSGPFCSLAGSNLVGDANLPFSVPIPSNILKRGRLRGVQKATVFGVPQTLIKQQKLEHDISKTTLASVLRLTDSS